MTNTRDCAAMPPDMRNAKRQTADVVRAFERREIAAALAWARAGNIALHFFRWSHPRYGTGEYCHVLCADRERLIAFGALFGWVPAVLQPPQRGRGVWHYDAYGWRTLALRRLVVNDTKTEGATLGE